MSKIVDTMYEVCSKEFRTLDLDFHAWDKSDCSDVGALLVMLKYIVESEKDLPYYRDSYGHQEDLYNYIFNSGRRFI